MSAAKKKSRHTKSGKKRKNLKRKIKIIKAIRNKKKGIKYKQKHSENNNIEKSKRSRAVFSSSGERIKVFHTMKTRFSFTIFIIFLITGVITALLFYLLRVITLFEEMYLNVTLLVAAMAIACIIIGTIISLSSTRIWFGRVNHICEAMREVAKGRFNTRIAKKDKKSNSTLTELDDLERTFNQMASDLESIEMFRNDFINNFSHEFKTPIVSIRGFARQLQSGNLSEEQKKEYIDVIVSESERLSVMSQNVLLLTKLETQSIVSEKTEFYLDEQIRHCILLMDKSWNEKEIEFDLDMDEITYLFNEEMLSHVWINLLSNAIKFTPQGGTIACKLKERDSKIIFEIQDNGIGMSPEVRERIFEKFFQGDTSHATKGNGIGLNIVKRILMLANGTIEAESTLGEGSKFTVTLNKLH